MRPPGRAAPRIFPGWLVVIGAFLVLMVGFGAINSYAAFAEAIQGEFGAGQASVSLIFALSGAACFFVSAVTGPLADRMGPRVPAVIGMALVGGGLMLAGTACSLVEIYAGYGLLVGLGTGFAYVPAMAAVQHWFVASRGLASGIAVSGIGVGTALAPAGAEALLHAGDWRLAFLLFGALATAIGVAGRRATFLASCGAMSANLLPWAFATAAPGLQAFALLFGALQGGVVALLPSFVADRFGARALGRVLGLLYTSRGVALLMAPPALAAAIGLFAGHAEPVLLAGLLGLAGTALLAR